MSQENKARIEPEVLKEIKEFDRKKRDVKASFWNHGLNKDGSEVIDTREVAVSIRVGVVSADQKLRQMLARELERAREQEETNLDELDFEVPQDGMPYAPGVRFNQPSAREVVNELQKSKQSTKQAAPDDGAGKAGPSKGAKPTEPAKDKSNVQSSARDSANPTGADDDDET